MRIVIAGFMIAGTLVAADTAVTFNKDVLPILQKNCQSCHRPGQIAPMSFLPECPWKEVGGFRFVVTNLTCSVD